MNSANVDPSEVEYYRRLADTWWDRQGPFWPLHRLNELRIDFVRDALCEIYSLDRGTPRPLSGLRLLDVGCGGGILSESMARMGASVHGIDVVDRNIAVASLHARSESLSIDYELTAVDFLVARNKTYDAVLNMEVVEHVPDAEAFMMSCAALVSPSGAMLVATLNRTVRSFLFGIVGAEHVLRWLPKGTHRWSRFCKPVELEAVLGRAGLDVVRRTGVAVNPITRSFSLSRSLAVNFMLVARRRPDRVRRR